MKDLFIDLFRNRLEYSRQAAFALSLQTPYTDTISVQSALVKIDNDEYSAKASQTDTFYRGFPRLTPNSTNT